MCPNAPVLLASGSWTGMSLLGAQHLRATPSPHLWVPETALGPGNVHISSLPEPAV